MNSDGKYTVLGVIGEGAYGKVYKGVNAATGARVAIKTMKFAFSHTANTKSLVRELKLLRHLRNHENILQIQDIFIHPPNEKTFREVSIVTNLMASDLESIIESRQTLTDTHISFFIYQILRALKFIHSSNVIHRDLKPSNVLVNANCKIAVCDFGVSRGCESDSADLLTQYVTTRWYRAPEMLCGSSYGKPVDIWSVGCIFAELILKYPLFEGRHPQHQLELIVNKMGCPDRHTLAMLIGNRTALNALFGFQKAHSKVPDFKEHFPRNTNPQALDLLRRMLQFDPSKRITTEEALRHPFLTSYYGAFSEPPCGEVFHDPFEENTHQMGMLFEAELRALLFEEASHYRSYDGSQGCGAGALTGLEADAKKSTCNDIESWLGEAKLARERTTESK